eukprot:GHUV01025585.1.p1 GENE.GHUV01025585.1~~GHUV01025585.1.p1  ORF type:complete len:450 (+),score=83.20 GHUV01025585.1:329-1678(+)
MSSLCLAGESLVWVAHTSDQAAISTALCTCCCSAVGDWLQGPYVYALYEKYGYSPAQIGQLFIAGFGSSLVVGTFVGAMADRLGRRTAGIAYVITYSLSCVTKHSPNFHVLMCGRVLGGIATSLLYSAFESWLVAEHFKRGFSEKALGQTFSWAVFLGNSLMAILAGFFGDFLVERMDLGRVAPFDAAIVFMCIGGAVMIMTWDENYGDSSSKDIWQQFGKAWDAIRSDQAIALLGGMQSLFEASMYSFVFLWTMAISPNKEAIKHGLIFVNFMTACMVGSFLSSVLQKHARPEQYMKGVYFVATAAMAVPMVVALDTIKDPSLKGKPITFRGQIDMLAFCVFEVCVGIFWPSMMTMRATYVPEELRATIINMFRIPLNAFVCVVLANVEAVPMWCMFGLCVAFLGISFACQLRLDTLSRQPHRYHKSAADEESSDGGAKKVADTKVVS